MKIGERGQVTIPKEFRDHFGLSPATEVEFTVQSDKLVLKKNAKPLNLRRWKGKCKGSLEKLGYSDVDAYIKDLRGR
jgi:AbrB family looped-hinge helix DNA binding protein